KVS
ncbi:dihydrodipicolinate reductase, family protein, partial [Vibrio parahaemolyticus VPTS-2010]